MPVITIDISKKSQEIKAKLIEGVTQKASEITGIEAAHFVVLINEFELDSIGVGGTQLSARKA